MALSRRLLVLAALIPLLAGCQQRGGTVSASLQAPTTMSARAMTPRDKAEVALGLRLFFDVQLSGNNRVSCGTCHHPKKGFSDGLPAAVGVEGRTGQRNTPSIIAAKHNILQFWDGRANSLEAQALGPLANPLEMDADLKALPAELQAIPRYERLFKEAYGTPATIDGIAKSIAAFERALETKPSPYDRWLLGDDSAMSPAAQRGQEVFARNRCGDCHLGPHLTDRQFHNVGWGMDRPNPDLGRYAISKDPADYGAFKTPSLRNVALTAPYFHDGRAKSLEEVVELYAKGGIPNENLDPAIQPLSISAAEKADLVAFMKALTSETNFEELVRMTVGTDPSALNSN